MAYVNNWGQMQDFRPLSTREIVGFSWSIYRQRFGPIMAISLLLVGVPSLLQWLPGVGGLMTLVLLLTELLATGAFVWLTASYCADLEVSAGQAMRSAWQRFTTMLGMWLAIAIAVATVAIVMILIGTIILAVVAYRMVEQLNEYANDPLAIPWETLLPFLIWTFVMVLPAIALAISWWAAPMAVMIEKTGAFDSLRRSWKLILPHYLRTVGVLLLSVAVIGPPIAVLYLVLPQFLAALLTSLWTVPMTAVIGTVLYLDLRARSEHLTHQTLSEELTSAF